MGQVNILNKEEVLKKIFIKKNGKNYIFVNFISSSNIKNKYYELPIISIKNKNGPIVLLIGANHGDETEGFISLLKLINNIKLEEINGHLIIIPALNLPALNSGQRVSLSDGVDMNRSFYKNTNRNLTFNISNFLKESILPNVEIILDFHSGGLNRKFADMAKYYHYENKNLMEQSKEIALAFGAPVCLKHYEKNPHGMLDTLAVKLNKIYISTELGGGGIANKRSISIADNGINNVLRFLKIIKNDFKYISKISRQKSKLLYFNDVKKNFIFSKFEGVFEVNVNINSKIKIDDLIGTIHFPNNPKKKSKLIVSKLSGIVIGITNKSFIKKGEFLVLIGDIKKK
tara:strand:- start:4212 stop:5243 length:1032 start_codon:yes stop_codon:yes gene_type:complete